MEKLAGNLKAIKWLLAANLVVILGGVLGLVFGLLPKLDRTIKVAESVEARFQDFADEVQPVVSAGAGKAIDTIQQMDAERLSETATEKADSLLGDAADRAKRFLEKDKE